ncbi:MAG: AMP-binding protein, partial [Deltaproteobacteria bacterium]|nr:AMP-binding protein [Deltaproteobacteria bacterium]
SNVESIYDVYQLNRDDCLIGVLPLFHSFGFTGTMWLPLLGGIRAVYHPNPVEGGVIGEMCRDHRGTILMSTPTFLLNYIRKVPAEHFATLRHVIVGAEKLKQRVADAFVEKFGVVPREGYGCTELSPVAMVNVPDFEGEHVQQKGSKPGTVGHPVPGVAARIVGVDDGALLSPGEPGLLLIKGPNVMLGYLNNEEKTREVIRDGWYVTGDIAVIDEEGFVSITDRLSRFSKIGGEMVPHLKIEEEIHAVLGANDQVCVVTSVPDEKKGEKLVVLVIRDIEISALLSGLSARGLPNLWIPKRENFFKIESFPVLGSGKLDLQQVKRIASDLAGKTNDS